MSKKQDRLEVYNPELEVMFGVGVIEDDKDFRDEFEKKVRERGFKNVTVHPSSEAFLSKFNKDIHIAVIDHFVDGRTGLEIMDEIFKINPYCYVIVVSLQDSKEVVIEYLNKGAWKYVDKNYRPQHDYEDEVLGFVDEALKEIQQEVIYFSAIHQQLRETKEDRSAFQQETLNNNTEPNDRKGNP